MPDHALGQPQQTVRTTCPYCGVGCGVAATPDGQGGAVIAGDAAHPASGGRLCSKGSALGETLDLGGRLLYPEYDGARLGWDPALDILSDAIQAAIARKGPDSVAFYVSGQCLTEDYYVANKLMKGYIGSGNIDTNSRLCMASSVAGHKRAFGEDLVPCAYEDLERADLIVLVGSNTAWCHPVLFRRIEAARAANPRLKIVAIDPRRSATAEAADLHLGIAPGSDAVLFNGLLAYLVDHGAIDRGMVDNHTTGFAAALEAARVSAPDTARVAEACGIEPCLVARFFAAFAATERVVTVYSQGVNQSSSGTDKVNAIINCHLATGRIGRPGMGPFSFTGQPNAMGGREVGGLANQLAAHMDFAPEDRERVRRFWNSPRIAEGPGLKAVDLFQAVERGEIEVLVVMATNPAVSMPDGDRVRRALAACPFVAVVDCALTSDTLSYAKLALPALAWGEKDGTVTNSDRTISRQRAFLAAPGEARADWWILAELGKRLGFGEAFDYPNAASIFREHAALSGFENAAGYRRRIFDISGLAHLTDAQYDALEPVAWPVTRTAPHGTTRLLADRWFPTPDGKACFIAITPRPPVGQVSPEYPLALNTGRVRDHWHTMTRTGKAPTLASHRAEPTAEIHPTDAAAQGISTADIVRVSSAVGASLFRAVVTDAVTPGAVFVPMHWGAAFARQAGSGALLAPITDPVSGQPELKHVPVAIAPVAMSWAGVVVSRRRLDLPAAEWSVAIRTANGWRYSLAGVEHPVWAEWARALAGRGGDWVELEDAGGAGYRALHSVDGKLDLAIHAADYLPEADLAWLDGFLDQPVGTPVEVVTLLAGRPADRGADQGAIVCSCHMVGAKRIEAAIAGGCRDTSAIGAATRAGTNCGSCLPELRAMLAATASPEPVPA